MNFNCFRELLCLLWGRKNLFIQPLTREASMIVSQKLISAIKLDKRRAYQIAWAAGVNPTMLSKLLNGIERPKPHDERIVAVGKIVGIPPEECFQGESTDKTVQECAY
jgi:hypothetical protein